MAEEIKPFYVIKEWPAKINYEEIPFGAVGDEESFGFDSTDTLAADGIDAGWTSYPDDELRDRDSNNHAVTVHYKVGYNKGALYAMANANWTPEFTLPVTGTRVIVTSEPTDVYDAIVISEDKTKFTVPLNVDGIIALTGDDDDYYAFTLMVKIWDKFVDGHVNITEPFYPLEYDVNLFGVEFSGKSRHYITLTGGSFAHIDLTQLMHPPGRINLTSDKRIFLLHKNTQ